MDSGASRLLKDSGLTFDVDDVTPLFLAVEVYFRVHSKKKKTKRNSYFRFRSDFRRSRLESGLLAEERVVIEPISFSLVCFRGQIRFELRPLWSPVVTL